MTPWQFLSTVWPSDGLFCIATPAGQGYRHKVCETIDEAVGFVDQIKNTHDVFFTIHTLKQMRVWNAAKKNFDGTVGGWSYRIGSNMRASRAFFFDLDVGEGDKKYATQRDAVSALQEFLKTTGLPTPMLVSSGGGIHVYWLVADEIASPVWIHHASSLKLLAQHYGLRVDPARTTDIASVLRVAGTFNHKGGTPRPVLVKRETKIVANDQFLKTLANAVAKIGHAPAQVAGNPVLSTAAQQLVQQFGTNTKLAFDGAPVSAKEVLTTCAQLRWMATEQDQVSEPEWYAGLGVMIYTSTPDAIHKFSCKYPRYDHAQTETKAEQAGRITNGPTSCEVIRQKSSRPDVCLTCPLFNASEMKPRVVNPMVGARNAQNTAPPIVRELIGNTEIVREIPAPPGSYRRPASGGVQMLIEKDEKQFLVPIYPYDFYPIHLANNATTGVMQRWRHHPPHSDGHTDIEVTGADWGNDAVMKIKLATNGIYPEDHNRLRQYMSAYIRHLQKTQPPVTQYDHLGWTEDFSAFVLPDNVLHTDGTITPAPLAPHAAAMQDIVTKGGTLLQQVNQLKFFNKPEYVENQFYIGSSLAAPLFWMTGQVGVIVNAIGKPGASKSTSLFTGAGLWGRPRRYVMNGTTQGATALYRAQRMEVLCNLPIGNDEITHTEASQAKAMAMNITQSGPRGRLKNDGTPREEAKSNRSTIMMCTSNKALQAMLATDNDAGTASAVRVVEIEFQMRSVHSPFEATVYLKEAEKNYGHLGEAMMRGVVLEVATVEKRVLDELESLSVKGNMTSDERCWFAHAASTFAALDYSRERGLIHWDIDYMRHWWLNVQLPRMRGTIAVEVEKNAPLTVITDYIEHVHNDVVKTDLTRGQFNVIEKPRGEMKGHWEADKGHLWLLRQPFLDYCRHRKVFGTDILNALQATGACPIINKRHVLGDGTVQAKVRSYCLLVDLNHASLSGVTPGALPQSNVVQFPAQATQAAPLATTGTIP